MLFNHNGEQYVDDRYSRVFGDIFVNHDICLLGVDQLLDNATITKHLDLYQFDFIFVVSDHVFTVGDWIQNYLSPELKTTVILFPTVDADSCIFPYWLMNYDAPVYYAPVYQYRAVKNNNNKKTYTYSCLNRAPNPHKIANLIKVHQSNYWNQTLVTYHGTDFRTGPDSHNQLNTFTPGGLEYFNQHIKKLLPIHSLEDYNNNPMDCNNPAYLDSYINIVVEHTIDAAFITEKTVKCLYAEQFFVIWGGSGSVRVLEENGIDTYRDIIDHGRYDNIENQKDRLDALHLLLNELSFLDWETIYNSTQARRQKNRLFLESGQIRSRFQDNLHKLLNKY